MWPDSTLENNNDSLNIDPPTSNESSDSLEVRFFLSCLKKTNLFLVDYGNPGI